MFDRRTLAVCCALAIPSASALAQSSVFDDRWYLTPFATYVKADSSRISDDGWGGGLSIGKPINPWWNIELRAQYEQLDSALGGPGKYKNWSGTLDAQFFFLGRQAVNSYPGPVQPYLVAGIGAINDKVDSPLIAGGSDNKTSFMANAGLGIVWPFASWGRLVADARYRYDDNHGNFPSGTQGHFDDWLFTVGLQIPLGPPPMQRVAQMAPPPAPMPPPPPPPPPPPQPRTVSVQADGTFEFDKAVLTPTGRTRIETTLQDYKTAGFRPTAISIVGFTDPLGSVAHNQRLSVARADAVRDYLVSRGVPANVIQTEGRGKNELKITEAQCRSQGARTRSALIACLEPNRRVEIRATGEQMPR